MNQYEKSIFALYEKLNIGKSDFCLKCRNENSDLSLPVSIWQVGDAYPDSQYKVLFVGKVARGNPGVQYHNFMDATNRADELYENAGWAYWNYTKAIANMLYSENAWEQIAFTNMVKCNNSGTIDTATDSMKGICVNILREELKILRPKNIVIYTGSGYDAQIESLFDKITLSKSQDVYIGAKKMNSWTFIGTIDNNQSKVIRVGHPERMKKIDYVNHIADYIMDN